MNIIEDIKEQYKLGGVAQKIIFWNVGIFVIPLVFLGILSLFNISFSYLDFFVLNSNFEKFITKPWSLISYGFFHQDFLHLIFNMISLYFFSQLFKTFFTEKQLIDVYFSGLIFSGIVFIISSYLFPAFSSHAILLGASGAIMTILMATTIYSPHFNVRLLLLGNVKLWHITLAFIILNFIQLSSTNSRGHIAHLGGALFGYLYIKQMRQGKNIALPFNDWYNKLFKMLSPNKNKTTFKKVYKNNNVNHTNNLTPSKSTEQKKIDDILDKISAAGYDSLTKEEKEFLFNSKP
jgi:membrane associated rhomboid family serine protease